MPRIAVRCQGASLDTATPIGYRLGVGDMAGSVVTRPRLLELLDGQDSGVCLITAASGYGKTTLLRNWFSARADPLGTPMVWLALSAGIVSRHAFWVAVVTSAGRAEQLDARTTATLIDDIEAAEDPLTAVVAFLERHGPVVIMLDAYEHLQSLTPEIDADVLSLTRRLPELRMMITTRGGSRLAERALQLRGQVQVVTERDLQFTAEETERLFAEHAPHIDRQAVRRVHRETRGYPLAIRAAALALAERSSAPAEGSSQWRALVGDDLKSQLADPDTIDFILGTCVPPYFDPELASTLTGSSRVAQILADLEWNGFGRWIPYARRRPVFQYVDSIRDAFLAELLQTDRPRHARAAAASAEWLHRNADSGLALGLAIDVGQYELADRIVSDLLISSPESSLGDRLQNELRRVPRSVLPAHPLLAFQLGLAYQSHRTTRGLADGYFRVSAAHAVDRLARATAAEAALLHTVKVASLRFVGRYEESGAAAAEALAYLEGMSAEEQDALNDLRPLVLRHLGYSLFQAGEVGRARAAVASAVGAATTPWVRNYTLAYGVGLDAFDGRDPQAEATRGMVTPDAWPYDHERTAMNALGIVGDAILLLDAFDHAGALDRFADAESFIHTAEFWPFIAWTMMNASLGLGEARIEAHRVEEALASSPPPPGVGPNLGTAAVHNLLAILWMAAGQLSKASEVLDTRTPHPGQLAPAQLLHPILSGKAAAALRRLPALLDQRGHTIRSQAATLTLGAVAAQRERNEATAVSLLDRAAALFHTHGPRAHLMYVPAQDLAGLRRLAADAANPRSIAYLNDPVVSPLAASDGLRPLTDRELAVLQAVIEHHTQTDVAKALYVSANTIKTQLRKIYRKLGVTTREQAIQRAIELDLLNLP